MAQDPVAHIRSASSKTGETIVYILRPLRNVAPGRPNITMVKGGGSIRSQYSPESLICIGDEVVAGPGTSLVVEFLIGGVVWMQPGASVQVSSERGVQATGESKAQLIQQLGKDIAWATLTLYGGRVVGSAGRFINANRCNVVNGVIVADATTMAATRLVPHAVRMAGRQIESVTGLVELLLTGAGAGSAQLPAAPHGVGRVAGIRG